MTSFFEGWALMMAWLLVALLLCAAPPSATACEAWDDVTYVSDPGGAPEPTSPDLLQPLDSAPSIDTVPIEGVWCALVPDSRLPVPLTRDRRDAIGEHF